MTAKSLVSPKLKIVSAHYARNASAHPASVPLI